MSKYFITFGGGTFGSKGEWRAVAERLAVEVTNTRLFDEVIVYTLEDLKSDKNFWSSHSEFIEKNKRGHGYWLWKPYLIRKTIRGMKDGDVLTYADAGCEIGIGDEDKGHLVLPIESCIEAAKEEKIVGTIVSSHSNSYERRWTKKDLPLHLGIADEPYMKEPQRQSGLVFFFVCEETRKLVNDWYSICCDYHLIDDSPSVSKNDEQFIEHRHDQSVFSQLTKKYGLFTYDYSFGSWRSSRTGLRPPKYPPNAMQQYCIQYSRCKKTS